MKRIISLLVCLTAVVQGANAASIVEQPDNTKHFSTENLVRQPIFEDYKKYIGGRLSANGSYSRPVILFSAEVQTINVDNPDDYLKMISPGSKHEKRKFYFNKVQAMIYKPQIIKIEEESFASYAKPYYQRPIVASRIDDETFEIVDVIRFTELYKMLIPFNDMAKSDFEANYTEVQNVKVKKTQLEADKEPKVFYRSAIPPIVLEIPEQNMPVFVLKDRSGKCCYWVPELTNETEYDMKEAMVPASYIDYLKHEYAGKKYIDKNYGTSLHIDDIVVKDLKLLMKKDDSSFELFSRYVERIKRGILLTESQYTDYLAEQERKKRLAEEKEQQEQREAERQRQLEEQRKQQELVRKYGAYYAECIANHRVEIGMPLAVVREMFWLERVSTQVTQGLKVVVYKSVIGGAYYTFVNDKLTGYQY